MDETPYVSGVFASVPECVLPGTLCVKGAPQAEEAACAAETARQAFVEVQSLGSLPARVLR